jgi:hypothetical protein
MAEGPNEREWPAMSLKDDALQNIQTEYWTCLRADR